MGKIANPDVRQALERAQLQDPALKVQSKTARVLPRIPEQAATAASRNLYSPGITLPASPVVALDAVLRSPIIILGHKSR